MKSFLNRKEKLKFKNEQVYDETFKEKHSKQNISRKGLKLKKNVHLMMVQFTLTDG